MDIFMDIADDQFRLMGKTVKWMNYQIKRGLREGVDFILVTKDVM